MMITWSEDLGKILHFYILMSSSSQLGITTLAFPKKKLKKSCVEGNPVLQKPLSLGCIGTPLKIERGTLENIWNATGAKFNNDY